jgi:hypothetical protein
VLQTACMGDAMRESPRRVLLKVSLINKLRYRGGGTTGCAVNSRTVSSRYSLAQWPQILHTGVILVQHQARDVYSMHSISAGLGSLG